MSDEYSEIEMHVYDSLVHQLRLKGWDKSDAEERAYMRVMKWRQEASRDD